MRGSISLIVALIVEFFLLIFILIVIAIGILGIFLPILPGLFLIGVGVGIYSLLVKKEYGKITPGVHWRLLKIRDKIFKLKMVEKFMAWFTKHSNKGKAWQAYAEILRHGLILAGFNIALALVYLLGFAVLSILFDSLEFDGLFSAYISMSAIFAFAAAGAIVWYRYGRILGSSFKQRKIINSSLVVLISILPILVFMILFSGIFDLAGGFGNEFMAIAFLVIILLAVLSAVFEFLIVSLGVMTPNK